ncbi:hypothetical protein GCM10027614_49790 [Micromonospora vulcania]
MQRVAASAPGGPLLIVAGPGTGKTRTLTHRIAYLCAELNVFPEHCLAITFTRRAAEELRHRLDGLLGPVAEDVTVGTFHALGLTILRENADAAGLPANFRIADDAERAAARSEAGDDLASYSALLRKQDLVDLDELVSLPVELLRANRELVERYRDRWRWIFVDEYQDVDAVQYELLRLLSPADGNLCAIGDPDQAIYSFRGADVGYFLRFSEDFTDARLVRLNRNYRSSAPILAAAVQAIAPSSLVRGRRLDPARLDPEAPLVGRYPRRPSPRRPTSSSGPSTSWSAGCPTGRWTRAGSTAGPRRCRSPTSRCCTAPTRRPHRSWTPWPGPTFRSRSAHTTGFGTDPAYRPSPASCDTPTGWPDR